MRLTDVGLALDSLDGGLLSGVSVRATFGLGVVGTGDTNLLLGLGVLTLHVEVGVHLEKALLFVRFAAVGLIFLRSANGAINLIGCEVS